MHYNQLPRFLFLGRMHVHEHRDVISQNTLDSVLDLVTKNVATLNVATNVARLKHEKRKRSVLREYPMIV